MNLVHLVCFVLAFATLFFAICDFKAFIQKREAKAYISTPRLGALLNDNAIPTSTAHNPTIQLSQMNVVPVNRSRSAASFNVNIMVEIKNSRATADHLSETWNRFCGKVPQYFNATILRNVPWYLYVSTY